MRLVLEKLIGGGKIIIVLSMLVCHARLTSYSICFHFLFTKFRKTLEGIRNIIEGMSIKVDIDSEPPILVEPEVIDAPEPE